MLRFDDLVLIDLGVSLTFRFGHDGLRIPVRISRDAMETHFGATHEGVNSLGLAYLAASDAVHLFARANIDPRVEYTRDHPLVLLTSDF